MSQAGERGTGLEIKVGKQIKIAYYLLSILILMDHYGNKYFRYEAGSILQDIVRHTKAIFRKLKYDFNVNMCLYVQYF